MLYDDLTCPEESKEATDTEKRQKKKTGKHTIMHFEVSDDILRMIHFTPFLLL